MQIFQYKRSIFAILVGQAVAMAGVACGTRILTECASTKTYGEAKLILGFISFFTMILIQPFNQFVMREYHDAVDVKNTLAFEAFVRLALLRITLITGAMVVLALITYRSITRTLDWVAIIAAGSYLVGEAIWTLEKSLMITCNRQIMASIMQGAEQWGLPLFASVGLLFLGNSAGIFIMSQAVLWFGGVVIIAWVGHLVIFNRSFHYNHEQRTYWLKEARQFISPMVGLGIFQWIVNLVDRYILAYFHGSSVVGQYSAIYGLCSFPLVVLGGMAARFLYPIWFRSATQRKVSLEKKIFTNMILFTASFAFVAVFVVILFSQNIANILLAAEYRVGATDLMVWIVAGYGLLIIAYAFEMRTYARKMTVRITVAYGLAAIANVLLNLRWIPRIGALGAAKATCATFAVYLLAMIVLEMGFVKLGKQKSFSL